jgi:hypothetical protein
MRSSGPVRRPAAQVRIGEHHSYDIWPRHHGDMKWPRRTRRLAWLTPRGQRPVPVPEPWWGRRFPRSRAWCCRLADGALHRGFCRLGTGSPHRGRARALTWCPGGCGPGIGSRSLIATRTHGCGGMGPGRSGRPRWNWGTVEARTEGVQQSIADRPASECPGKRPGAMLHRRPRGRPHDSLKATVPRPTVQASGEAASSRMLHTSSPVLLLIVARVLWTARPPARPLLGAEATMADPAGPMIFDARLRCVPLAHRRAARQRRSPWLPWSATVWGSLASSGPCQVILSIPRALALVPSWAAPPRLASPRPPRRGRARCWEPHQCVPGRR